MQRFTVAHKVYLIYSVYYIKRLHCIVFSFIRRTWHVRNLPFTISIIRINWEIEINGFIHTSCYIVFTKCASSSREMVSSSSGTSWESVRNCRTWLTKRPQVLLLYCHREKRVIERNGGVQHERRETSRTVEKVKMRQKRLQQFL